MKISVLIMAELDTTFQPLFRRNIVVVADTTPGIINSIRYISLIPPM